MVHALSVSRGVGVEGVEELLLLQERKRLTGIAKNRNLLMLLIVLVEYKSGKISHLTIIPGIRTEFNL